MLSNKNNLRSELTANVWVLDTTISITSWEWVLWENNMVACLEHYESGVCTKREVIKITAKSTDTFTITRWFADCIMNDNTKAQGHGSQTFSVGDYLSLYLSKEIWESLTTWISTNETAIQTMVARINAPRTCINNCCQSWKNAIDTAYYNKYCWNSGFGTGADGDCVITVADLDAQWYKYLCASCEYNFNNLTICEWVKVRFLWNWVPTINVWNNFKNFWEIDLRAWFVAGCCQTDCWLEKWCTICNKSCNNICLCCGGAWWLWATYSEWRTGWTGATWCPWTASCWWAGGGGWSWYPWWAGCPWWAPSWENGWNGWRWWNCSAWYSWWWGGWWGGWWWRYWNGWNGWNGGVWDSWAHAHGVGGNGWNSGLFGTGWTGGEWWSDWNNGAWNGWNWFIGWTGWAGWSCWPAGQGGCGVVKWWTGGEAYSYRQAWNGWNAITNVYWFHLNARNIWNNCVNARWWDGWKGGQAECWQSGNGGNGWNGGQMIISYDCMNQEWCFDVSGGCGGEPWHVRRPSCWWTSWSCWCAWSDGWKVFKAVNYPYISNFTLESDEDNEAILISWRDPSIKQSASQKWTKTVVRYSTSNYPTTPTDWTLAVQETVKNQYENTPYSLTGVLDETTYYFSIFALDQNNTIIDVQSNSITTDFLRWKYQKVEYIQSSWSQYIHTSIIPTNSIWLYMKVSSQNVSNDLMYVWSNDNSSDSWSKKFWIWNSSYKLYFWWNNWLPPSQNRPSTTANTIVELENNFLNSRLMKKDNNTIYNISETLTSNWFPINIFAHNWWWTAQYFSSIKLYSLKISDSSTITYEFVPCYRKSDNVIWLLEIKHKIFYTNQWSWSFQKWPDIN